MPGILVIDDDPGVVPFIAAAVKSLAVEVLGAETAKEGLRLLEGKCPDVVLLDIKLHNESGIDVFERIRRIDERVPVIFITAGGESETAIEAMKLGALDFLLKPLDVARVKQLVQQGLEIRRLMEIPVELPEDAPTAGDHRTDWPQPADAGGV